MKANDWRSFDWDMSDRYRSNNGTGPLTMRILSVSNGVVTFERWNGWNREGRRPVRGQLDYRSFVKSGWKLTRKDAPATNAGAGESGKE